MHNGYFISLGFVRTHQHTNIFLITQ